MGRRIDQIRADQSDRANVAYPKEECGKRKMRNSLDFMITWGMCLPFILFSWWKWSARISVLHLIVLTLFHHYSNVTP